MLPADLLAEWLSNIATDPWPVVVPLLGTVLVVLLYWRGVRYETRTGIGRPITRLRALAFLSGLLVILFAVASPLDVLADTSLAWHMVQHELLILVVPPLLLAAAPLWPLWRALPLGWRRAALRWLFARHRTRRIVEGIPRFAGRPVVAWILFVGTFLLWHVPALYDLALTYEWVHAFEHLVFLATATLFWAQVIPSFPVVPRLSYLRQVGFVFAGALVMHLTSVLISIAAEPIYPYYGTGPAAVAAQGAAGAIMDVSGMVVYTCAMLVCAWLWLRDDERHALTQGTLGAAAGVRVAAAEPSVSGTLLLAESDGAEPHAPPAEG